MPVTVMHEVFVCLRQTNDIHVVSQHTFPDERGVGRLAPSPFAIKSRDPKSVRLFLHWAKHDVRPQITQGVRRPCLKLGVSENE